MVDVPSSHVSFWGFWWYVFLLLPWSFGRFDLGSKVLPFHSKMMQNVSSQGLFNAPLSYQWLVFVKWLWLTSRSNRTTPHTHIQPHTTGYVLSVYWDCIPNNYYGTHKLQGSNREFPFLFWGMIFVHVPFQLVRHHLPHLVSHPVRMTCQDGLGRFNNGQQ